MQAGRLLSIVLLLQVRGRLTAEALAEEFEVSVRTIYRDIDQLAAAGVPLHAERGRNGGVVLEGGFRPHLAGLTPAEAQALSLVGAGAAAQDLGLGADLASAQLKLLASLPQDHGAGADRVASRFHLDPAPWYGGNEPHAHLKALAAAVWRETKIRIEYESWKGGVARTLDPLGLVLKGGVWYLVAASKGAPRTYRVSNIRSLKMLEAPARRSKGFHLERYWRGWARDFEARLLTERARIRLSREGLRRLGEISPAAAEAARSPETMRILSNGRIEADIPMEKGPYAVRQLLFLGAEVEVTAPLSLREALAAAAAEIAALNRVRPARNNL
jgi:predicted DNA-binding transcriptional regulator YafY